MHNSLDAFYFIYISVEKQKHFIDTYTVRMGAERPLLIAVSKQLSTAASRKEFCAAARQMRIQFEGNLKATIRINILERSKCTEKCSHWDGWRSEKSEERRGEQFLRILCQRERKEIVRSWVMLGEYVN